MHALRLVSIGAIALGSALMLGCGGTSVERMDVNKTKDLSGDWNDTDSRMVSEEMVKDVLSAPWLARSKAEGKKTPSLIVGEIKNLSHEHIAVNTFVGDIERVLINAGDVQFVASSTERQEIRTERKDQDTNAAEETRKAMGKEQGADFMLKGEINTIIDAEGKTQVKYYQIDLTLISLADNRKVWVGQKKIKKLVEKGKMRI
jgi:penicillin-binding protein activator